MMTLITKDGEKTGNAILYALVCDAGLNVAMVETDFGNKMSLTLEELNDLFLFGKPEEYSKWKQDRYDKVSEVFRVKHEPA